MDGGSTANVNFEAAVLAPLIVQPQGAGQGRFPYAEAAPLLICAGGKRRHTVVYPLHFTLRQAGGWKLKRCADTVG